MYRDSGKGPRKKCAKIIKTGSNSGRPAAPSRDRAGRFRQRVECTLGPCSVGLAYMKHPPRRPLQVNPGSDLEWIFRGTFVRPNPLLSRAFFDLGSDFSQI
jgi:hypothetical protein